MDSQRAATALRAEPGRGGIRRALRARALALFAIDLRSLALFRIGAAVFLIFDLASRLPLLAVNYTDAGAQPRAAVLPYLGPSLLPSLHLLAGSFRFELVLFALAALAAVLLGVGYRTRLATALSWFLLDSLHARNGLVLDGGDHLLRHLLFWSLFLPLGARWSLDARRCLAPARPVVCTPASAALLLQVACMFFLTGLLKTGPEWSDGTAIQYALSRKWWIQPFGAWLLAHPPLPRLMTPAVHWFELLAPWALFVPVFTAPLRLCMIPAFWGFLAGLGLGLKLNLFPWISGLGMLPFLPAFVWDALGSRAQPAAPGLPSAPADASGGRRRTRALRFASAAGHGLVLGLLVLELFVAAGMASSRLAPPSPLARVAQGLHLEQGWWMYAPSPRRIDVWFEHRGQLVNGVPVDLDRATGGTSWTAHVKPAWQDYRFMYYLQKLADPKWAQQASAYALWLCREWNADREGGARLDRVSVSAVIQPISLDDEAKPETRLSRLFEGACPR